ncbi:MAG: hypothetical protein MZV65_36600 [Chromatiales bacterium]|nr:hypothetical protein [Chromatiales bacterium]
MNGKPDQTRQQIAQHQRRHRRFLAVAAQEQGQPGEAEPAGQRHAIAEIAVQAEFVAEEQQHPDQDHRQTQPVVAPRPLAQKPRAEQRDVHRSGVLQQDGVGGRWSACWRPRTAPPCRHRPPPRRSARTIR